MCYGSKLVYASYIGESELSAFRLSAECVAVAVVRYVFISGKIRDNANVLLVDLCRVCCRAQRTQSHGGKSR